METKKLTTCPKCGGELTIRKDDNEEVIRERINKQGNLALKPIADYYQELGILKVVDGDRGIGEVEMEISDIIRH